jgi:hypothetical protein
VPLFFRSFQAYTGEKRWWNESFIVLADCADLVSSIRNVTFSFCPREANEVIHDIAMFCFHNNLSCIWDNNPRRFLLNTLIDDVTIDYCWWLINLTTEFCCFPREGIIGKELFSYRGKLAKKTRYLLPKRRQLFIRRPKHRKWPTPRYKSQTKHILRIRIKFPCVISQQTPMNKFLHPFSSTTKKRVGCGCQREKAGNSSIRKATFSFCSREANHVAHDIDTFCFQNNLSCIWTMIPLGFCKIR